MRVLILSAFLAYAAAAPSGIIGPVFYQAVGLPAAVPTISPGDIQAAAINTQVQINDLTRAAADKAQEIADQAVSNANEKVVTDVDQVNERSLEAFWSNEDKKWQALDALKTAEAQIDGAAASNAGAYANTAFKGAVSYVAGVSPVVAAPIAPAVYTPYVTAVKSVSTQTVEVKAEENKEEKNEAVVKTAEPEKPAQAEAEEGEKIEAATAEKSSEEKKAVVFPGTLVAPINLYRYNVALPALGHIVAQPAFTYATTYHAQPIVNYATSYQQVNGVVTPTLIKHAW